MMSKKGGEKVLRLGFVPTRRKLFDIQEAIKYKELVKEKTENILWEFEDMELYDIDWVNDEGLLFDEADLEKVVDYLKENEVDAVFFPHCNFGSEDLVGKVAKAIGKPVLLWGPRDDAPDETGIRARDTQCGLFATSKVLRRMNIPFTYITNSWVDSDVFESGLKDFVRVANVVKQLGELRILQISTRPNPFWTMIFNEGELLERFGIQVVPVTIYDLKLKMDTLLSDGDERVEEVIEYIDENFEREEGVTDEDIRRLSVLKVAIKEMAQENRAKAVAIQCWTSLQDMVGLVPCLANAMLTDEGLPVVCETDIHGAITAIIAQSVTLGKKPIFFADLTIRHPENENGELLWHCGPFPPSLAKFGIRKVIGGHYLMEGKPFGLGNWEIEGGDVTILRFDGDHGEYRLLVGEAKGIDGPYVKGTYLWIEVNDWPLWENIIINGPYVHHVAGVHGKYKKVLTEVTKYIPGLTVEVLP